MKKWIVLLAAVCMISCALPVSAQAAVWLENGQTNDTVYSVQGMLRSLGYYWGDLDSYYGPATEQSVIWFQQDYGLLADGIVGDITMDYLTSLTGGYYAPAEPEPVAETASYGSDLYVGITGDAVASMQTMLVKLGFMANIVDGVFGYVTEDAVIRFQQAYGLWVDGVVGPQTLGALQSASGGAAPVAQAQTQPQAQTEPQPAIVAEDLYEGMVSDAVLALQSKLASLGYPVYADGVFGAQTAEIVRQFQTNNGLWVDGVVGPQTAAKLNNSPVGYTSAPAASSAASPAVTTAVYDGVTLTEDIAAYMKDLVSSVTTSSMSKEQKLAATFDYIADRNNYPYIQNRIPYYRGEDWPVVYAHDMMYLGGSYCHGYASLFGYAAVLSGYNNVHWAQNGYHAWVDVDGLVYDPVFRDSSYSTRVYGWSYDQAISNNGYLGAGYDYPGSEGTYQFIKAPQF